MMEVQHTGIVVAMVQSMVCMMMTTRMMTMMMTRTTVVVMLTLTIPRVSMIMMDLIRFRPLRQPMALGYGPMAALARLLRWRRRIMPCLGALGSSVGVQPSRSRCRPSIPRGGPTLRRRFCRSTPLCCPSQPTPA
eukprot:Rmarinus@m.29957